MRCAVNGCERIRSLPTHNQSSAHHDTLLTRVAASRAHTAATTALCNLCGSSTSASSVSLRILCIYDLVASGGSAREGGGSDATRCARLCSALNAQPSLVGSEAAGAEPATESSEPKGLLRTCTHECVPCVYKGCGVAGHGCQCAIA